MRFLTNVNDGPLEAPWVARPEAVVLWRNNGKLECVIEKRYDGTSQMPFSTVKIDWTYDALGRLVAETRDLDDNGQRDPGDYTDFFAFDLAGNRVLKVRGWDANGDGVLDGEEIDQATTSTFNARDQLLQEFINGTLAAIYAYDDNGSTISVTHPDQTVLRYVWDLRNKLVGLDADGDGTLDDAGDATFAYDFEGVRVRRSVIGEQTTYYLQTQINPTGYSQVLEEWARPDELTPATLARSYVIGLDVIAQSRTSAPAGREVEYLLYDGGGHTRGLLDATGQPLTAEIYAYDAFGNRIQGPSVTATSLLYRGEYFDATLGQYVLRARYYDPSSGRFWSFDSYEASSSDPLSLHKYLYANANPIYYMDPSGTFASVMEPLITTATSLLRFARIAIPVAKIGFAAWDVVTIIRIAVKYAQGEPIGMGDWVQLGMASLGLLTAGPILKGSVRMVLSAKMLKGLSIGPHLRTFDGALNALSRWIKYYPMPPGTTNAAGKLLKADFLAKDGIPVVRVLRSGDTLKDATSLIHEFLHYLDWLRHGKPVGAAWDAFKASVDAWEYGSAVNPVRQLADLIMQLASL